MEKAATIARALTGKDITTMDMYYMLMSLKLSRMSHSPEFDSMVDLCGYTEGLWNYINEQQKED